MEYSYKDEGFICARSDGGFASPSYVTHNHKKALDKPGLKHIRFYDFAARMSSPD